MGACNLNQLTSFGEAGVIGFLGHGLRHGSQIEYDVQSGQVTSQLCLEPPLSHNCFGGDRAQQGKTTSEHQNRFASDLLSARFGGV